MGEKNDKAKQMFSPNKILGETIFCPENLFGKKRFWDQKRFGSKNCWVQSKKFLDLKSLAQKRSN